MQKILTTALLYVVFAHGMIATSAYAADAMLQADEAVAELLFDYDFDSSFATYSVSDSGFVRISFASNMPDALYSEILNELKSRPEIEGVLAGKTLPACSAW